VCHLGDGSTRPLPPRLQRLLLRSGDLSDRRLGPPRSHRLDAGSSPGPTRRALKDLPKAARPATRVRQSTVASSSFRPTRRSGERGDSRKRNGIRTRLTPRSVGPEPSPRHRKRIGTRSVPQQDALAGRNGPEHGAQGRPRLTVIREPERPAYGAECEGLGFLIVVMGVRLVGFAGGLMILGGWTRSCVGAGACARLRPYVACKRVVSRQPSSGLWWRRAGLPMVFRGM
jgi:hypothetical protein